MLRFALGGNGIGAWAVYVLIVYDVDVKRVGKIHKYLKRHLNWVQNSVFEGELTDSQIEEVRIGLGKLMDKDTDSVLIYTAREERWLNKQVIGCERGITDNLL
jgi:CRISPR-associated protein Cas2